VKEKLGPDSRQHAYDGRSVMMTVSGEDDKRR